MKRVWIPLLFFGIILFTLFVLFFRSGTSRSEQDQKPRVAATIFPLYDITREITQDLVSVTLILPPGASPHTFEPTTTLLKELSITQAVYRIGSDLDRWIESAAKSSAVPLITVDDGIVLRKAVDEEESSSGIDPHYWLTVRNAQTIAKTIAQDLQERFPELADEFEKNLNSYLAELDATEQEVRSILSQVENPSVVTFHDAWFYFAEAYGLQIVGTYEPTAAREPTPQYLADLLSLMEASNTDIIYSEVQSSNAVLQAFLQDYGYGTAFLDDIGGSDDRDSYIELMKYNAKTIADNQ